MSIIEGAEKLKAALAEYAAIRDAHNWYERSQTHQLVGLVEEHLPALLAELDRLRAAMGDDIETATGFSGKATEALK